MEKVGKLPNKENLTPMMQQYLQAKQACGDALLLFRMGDFYELFYEDAKVAARVLNLALTSREKGENAAPMAGFPHHQLDAYLARLLKAGFRVAVCEQVEDPRLAKGLVRREITRIVTPGTAVEETVLEPRERNFLVAVMPGAITGLAWVELATGLFMAQAVSPDKLADQLERLRPTECLLPEDANLPDGTLPEGLLVTRRPAWAFNFATAREKLTQKFQTSTLEGFGFGDTAEDHAAVCAAGAIVDYLEEINKDALEQIENLLPFRAEKTLQIDHATRRSLELTRTLRDGSREGSLLGVLDMCATAMGSRLLAEWLSAPLTDIEAINRRLDAIEELVKKQNLIGQLRKQLERSYDLERLTGRVVGRRATPRDLLHLARTLKTLPDVKVTLDQCTSELLRQLAQSIDPHQELCELLLSALENECPLSATEGGFIRSGFSRELDELRELAQGGKRWIAQYQARQAAETGIPNLKVGYNKVFGYYIEVTNTHRDKVPDSYIRKQTLKHAERYVTPELKQYEEKILSADEKARQLEYELFVQLRDKAAAAKQSLRAAAAALAQIDVLTSLALVALRRNYCRPVVVEEPVVEIVDGRHPVLDVTEPQGTFVPNDTRLGGEHGKVLIITGPNMSGKSTYIRQVALITIMAQMGSFVPAKKAVIGIADQLFARIGASDELSRGQSTFMVEMLEAARILNNATERSLVILDEIGRGTSTYDGISLAWAITEYIHDRIGCRTLFATHYHELTDLGRLLDGVRNMTVLVKEWADQVIFLHKIVDGAADKSYGIHVAKLAGIPRSVIERAKDILAMLEEEHLDADGRPKIAQKLPKVRHREIQLTLFGPADHPVLDEIRTLQIENTTPLEALNLIRKWQEELEKE